MKSQDNNGCFNTGKRQKAKGKRRNFFVLCFLPFALCFTSYAQDAKIPLIYQSTMLGIGKTSAYDSYLSPLKYTGDNLGLLYEQMKMTDLANGKIAVQHLYNFEIAQTNNQQGTATNYIGSLEYGYGMYYRFETLPHWQLFAGAQADGLFGFIYNNRNGNNPATGKAHLNLNLSGIAAYNFQIQQQTLQLRYQINIPLAGCMFSPQFGQSYYEIGEGDTGNLLHFASLHNQWAMRNLFSIEIPFSRYILRFTYMNWIYETQINQLDTRIISNSFYVGVSKNFYIVSKKQNKNNYRHVFE